MSPSLRSVVLATACATLLSGCVAAALPAVAAVGVAKSRTQKKHRERPRRERARRNAPTLRAGQTIRTPEGGYTVTGLTQLPPPDGSTAAVASGGAVPPGMQYLYGSGEAAAQSLQTYQSLWYYLRMEIGYRRDKASVRSVLLSTGSTLDAPKFDRCGKRPMAIVLDVDETVLLNQGFEADDARHPGRPYDEARWRRWEASGAGQVSAVPGAVEALNAARGAGFTVIFNTNRSTANAAATQKALEQAGLGPVVPGDTLILRDEGAPSGKDARRWKIAEKYCVVAMLGDQLGDFSDLFNAPGMSPAVRRNAASQTQLATLWGAGWFMLPNPVYGTALKGGLDDVFPKDKQWADPAEEKR